MGLGLGLVPGIAPVGSALSWLLLQGQGPQEGSEELCSFFGIHWPKEGARGLGCDP